MSDYFNSPARTSLEELVNLRAASTALHSRPRQRSLAPMQGAVNAKRLGRGLDFAEVREYLAGDDIRMIDWKVTARSGKTHTKLFVEERERPVFFIIDYRQTMQFATRGMFKSVLAARLSALIGWQSVTQGERIGGFVFNNDWHREIRPQSGRRGLMALFRAIDEAQHRSIDHNDNQLERTFLRLRRSVHAGSTLYFLSDFHGFNDKLKYLMGAFHRSYDVVAVHISDPLDYELPQPGAYSIVSASATSNQRRVISVSKRDQLKYTQQYRQHIDAIRREFTQQGGVFFSISTQQPLLKTASSVLNRQPLVSGA